MDTASIIVLAHSPSFRLGRTEVRPATREVIGPVAREIVEPRVMQVLVALANVRGEILSRDDLIQSCWEGRIVSENAIDRVISKIRRLAETVANGDFRIETITKVGYRLLEGDGAAGETAPVLAEPVPAAARGRGPDRRAVIFGSAAVGFAGAAAWWVTRKAQPEVPAEVAPLYERGVESMRRGWAEDVANGVSALRQVVTIAPDFPDGWGMLALAYQTSLQFAPPEAAGALRERARSAARRALEIDPGNANALAAQALAVPIYGNWAAAEAACRRALDRDPNQMEARFLMSQILANVGRMRAALAELDVIAEPISALPFHQYWLAWLLFCASRLEESDRVIDRALSTWPRNFAVWFTRMWLYAYTGRTAQAAALLNDVPNRPIGIPDRDFDIVALSVRAITSRTPSDLNAAVRANMEAAPSGFGFAVNAIKVSACLGRLDEAFAAAHALYFGRGFRVAPVFFTPQQGGYTPPEQRGTEFLFSPVCRPMRTDPRFPALMEETGLAAYWRSTGTRADVARP